MPAQSSPTPSEGLLFSPLEASPPNSHGSGMSDERNADSVLFQLESVAQMNAAQPQDRARQPSLLARLAAPAPASKAGSGLIDIKTLAAAEASSQTGSSSSVSDATLLSSTSMLGLASSSEADPVVVLGKQSARTPLIVLSVLTLLSLAAVVVAVVLRGL